MHPDPVANGTPDDRDDRNGQADVASSSPTAGRPVLRALGLLARLVRGVVGLVLLVLGLTAVLAVPHIALWKPAVLATEGGHFLAPIAFGLAASALPALRRRRSPGTLAVPGIALLAGLLLLSPLVRAAWIVGDVAASVDEALGPLDSDTNDDTDDAGDPLRLAPLLRIRSGPPVDVERLTYETVDGTTLRLDLYGARAPGGGAPEDARPCVLVIHGGSWRNGDQTQLPDVNHHLARAGYAVAAISYRLAPAHRFPAQIEDVRAALEHLTRQADELGIDPTRFVLLGRSAGGQIALTAAYSLDDPAIRGVVALYAPTDMHWSWTHPSDPWILDSPGSLRAYLGGGPDEAPDAYDRASPIERVGPGTVPTLLLHGERDELVYFAQSERLADRLASAGVPHVLVRLPWATHGFDANLCGPAGQIYIHTLERFLAFATQ